MIYMQLKYSAYTLQKLHERAAGILEIIAECEKRQKNNLDTAKRMSKDNHFYFNQITKAIPHHIKYAWKCRRVANYLKIRYSNLMNRINP